jgi:hypothetical protein
MHWLSTIRLTTNHVRFQCVTPIKLPALSSGLIAAVRPYSISNTLRMHNNILHRLPLQPQLNVATVANSQPAALDNYTHDHGAHVHANAVSFNMCCTCAQLPVHLCS